MSKLYKVQTIGAFGDYRLRQLFRRLMAERKADNPSSLRPRCSSGLLVFSLSAAKRSTLFSLQLHLLLCGVQQAVQPTLD